MPGGDSMKEIVKNASAQAMPGDVVLLSTACASFGMFKNYEDRGKQFNQAVAELS
jgi:UDP-N-acetylmuramoylalanine--D-glutamate ligase